jgi:hypothetical protein
MNRTYACNQARKDIDCRFGGAGGFLLPWSLGALSMLRMFSRLIQKLLLATIPCVLASCSRTFFAESCCERLPPYAGRVRVLDDVPDKVACRLVGVMETTCGGNGVSLCSLIDPSLGRLKRVAAHYVANSITIVHVNDYKLRKVEITDEMQIKIINNKCAVNWHCRGDEIKALAFACQH